MRFSMYSRTSAYIIVSLFCPPLIPPLPPAPPRRHDTARAKVREVDKLSTAEGTTTSELREKLRHVADEFVSPESATEVNVDGSSREGVLCSIKAALEAAGSGSSQGGGGGESPWAWVLAVEATEALVELARELHTVIFDGLWPRFLTSDEFTVMMNTEVCACVFSLSLFSVCVCV